MFGRIYQWSYRSRAFLCWEVFDDWFNVFISLQVSDFLFHYDSVLESFESVSKICPFHLSHPICWCTAIHQFNSLAQSCLTLCNPTDGSTPSFCVHHNLPELAQTHVHWIDDAHPLSPPSPSAINPFPASRSFPMNGLFASGGQSLGASASASVFLLG